MMALDLGHRPAVALTASEPRLVPQVWALTSRRFRPLARLCGPSRALRRLAKGGPVHEDLERALHMVAHLPVAEQQQRMFYKRGLHPAVSDVARGDFDEVRALDLRRRIPDPAVNISQVYCSPQKT
jgi:hypothetical protein